MKSLRDEKQDLTKALEAVTEKLRGEISAWVTQSKLYLDNNDFDLCDTQVNVAKAVHVDAYIKMSYEDHRIAVKNMPQANEDSWRCGETGEKATGAADDAHKWKLDITYCPEDWGFCCDDAENSTGDGSNNHQPQISRAKGICHWDKVDIRCKSVSEGNHSSNWRWHYRWSNFGACDLRKHKFQQRKMWWLLYGAYKNFKAYYNCMGPWRADGYRTDQWGKRIIAQSVDETQITDPVTGAVNAIQTTAEQTANGVVENDTTANATVDTTANATVDTTANATANVTVDTTVGTNTP